MKKSVAESFLTHLKVKLESANNIINLDEIRYAKKVIKDIPEILKILDKFNRMLYNYNEYSDVNIILEESSTSKLMLELILDAYKLVLKENGVISNETQV